MSVKLKLKKKKNASYLGFNQALPGVFLTLSSVCL